jgi:hypothetical protein
MGQCQAECVGECHGTCFNKDGSVTSGAVDDVAEQVDSDVGGSCNGKCSSGCNGTCRGLCKIEEPEGLTCGADVRCKGGCTASASEPKCTTEFLPPECEVDTVCHDICSARVTSQSVCTPTTVSVYISSDSPELEPLATALQDHLPPLIDAAEREGKLALNAGNRMLTAASELEGRIDDLGGKSLACLGASTTRVAATVSDLKIAVESCGELVAKVEGRTQ